MICRYSTTCRSSQDVQHTCILFCLLAYTAYLLFHSMSNMQNHKCVLGQSQGEDSRWKQRGKKKTYIQFAYICTDHGVYVVCLVRNVPILHHSNCQSLCIAVLLSSTVRRSLSSSSDEENGGFYSSTC